MRLEAKTDVCSLRPIKLNYVFFFSNETTKNDMNLPILEQIHIFYKY